MENAKVFKAFCDENRLMILEMLQSGEKCACRILDEIQIAQSTLSHHMKMLVESGIVSPRKDGKWTYYSLSETGIHYAKELLVELTTIKGDVVMSNKEEVREQIRKRYAEVALNGSSGACCSSSCCGSNDSIKVNGIAKKIGYSEDDLSNVPIHANMGLGCGKPIAIAALKEGEVVLDLGSGGGFDCFLARRQVGETGLVIGVDMTSEMIKLARKNVEKSGYSNVDFRLGEIEHLPVADSSVDVIISNCVINLSLDKEKVFKESYRVLKVGGRLSISDVVATAKLPEDIKHDIAKIAGCIAGAEYVENIKEMLNNTGFKDINLKPKDNSKEILSSWIPDKNIEDFVASYIIEAIK